MSEQRTSSDMILDSFINKEKKRFPPTLSESEFFEIFTAQQVLKDKDLSDSEISKGIVGNGGDGGIDSVYFFINNKLIQEDIKSYDYWVKDIKLDLFIIQSKTSRSFGEDVIRKFIDVTDDVFAVNSNLKSKEIRSRYDARLLEAAVRFKEVYLELVTRGVKLTFNYVYASRGEIVDPKVNNLTNKLKSTVENLFKNVQFNFNFLGADKLVQIAGRVKQTKKEILYTGPVIHLKHDSLVILVTLKNFYRFLTDSDGSSIDRHIFEANVRDYQGEIGVNKEIRDTLNNPGVENFWWLNNGITILTSGIEPKGNIGYLLDSPEIVNGLQTSTEIYNTFAAFPADKLDTDDRQILIRIIVPPDDPTRNRIIKATNSQTKIPPFALKATDSVQWQIEQFLLTKDLYYDRRKNFYKNQGQPQSKIIAMLEMAQAILAIKLARPNDARARPGNILDDENEYRKVFSEKIPLQIYYAVLQIMERVDVFLTASGLTPNERNNLRFYLAWYAVCQSARKARLDDEHITAAPSLITKELLDAALPVIKKLYTEAGGDDNAAKGSLLFDLVELELVKHFMHSAYSSFKKRLTERKAIMEKKTTSKESSAPKEKVKKVTVKKSAAPRKAAKSSRPKSVEKTTLKKKAVKKTTKKDK